MEGPAGHRKPVELRMRDGRELRMPMPKVERAVRGEQVEIAPPVDVADPRALAFGDHNRQRRVVPRTVRRYEVDRCPGPRRRAVDLDVHRPARVARSFIRESPSPVNYFNRDSSRVKRGSTATFWRRGGEITLSRS